MVINQRMLTSNDCYKAGKTIRPKGIMVHSTATPGVMAEQWCKKWNTSGVGACVHAFIDNSGVYQCLPWDMRGWHAGGGANDTHISFEICEPSGIKYNSNGSAIISYDTAANQGYFDAVWENAVSLCAMLCKQYGLDQDNIICHSEGYVIGIASNHADVMHWFPKHGRTMNDFREAVRKKLEEKKMSVPSDWAKEACGWAVETGLILGDGAGEYNWQEPVTRDSFAVILKRYNDMLSAEKAVAVEGD